MYYVAITLGSIHRSRAKCRSDVHVQCTYSTVVYTTLDVISSIARPMIKICTDHLYLSMYRGLFCFEKITVSGTDISTFLHDLSVPSKCALKRQFRRWSLVQRTLINYCAQHRRVKPGVKPKYGGPHFRSHGVFTGMCYTHPGVVEIPPSLLGWTWLRAYVCQAEGLHYAAGMAPRMFS